MLIKQLYRVLLLALLGLASCTDDDGSGDRAKSRFA